MVVETLLGGWGEGRVNPNPETAVAKVAQIMNFIVSGGKERERERERDIDRERIDREIKRERERKREIEKKREVERVRERLRG